MKKIIITILLFVFQNTIANIWQTSYEEAQKISLATNKLILIHFCSVNWEPCNAMERNVWSELEIKQLCENFVLLKIDIEDNQFLTEKYNIKYYLDIPRIVLIDANGKQITNFDITGGPNKLKENLIDYTLSTEYLSNDLINFYKLNNYSNALRLANKYFDFGINVNKKIKNKFIDVAIEYIDVAKNLINNNEDNIEEKKQKLELYKLYKFVYNFEFDKLEKRLTKGFTEDKISINNKSQYYFLLSIIALHQSKNLNITAADKDVYDVSHEKAKIIYTLSKKS